MKIAIVGTVGVPAQYGGFETLAENLLKFNQWAHPTHEITVYCSAKAYKERPVSYRGAILRYIPLNANGIQAIFYDIWSIVDAALRGNEIVILLGHGGSFIIPVLKLCTATRYITNIDGIEWKRNKWNSVARWVIRKSENIAVRHSHIVVVDNEAIRNYVHETYRSDCEVIAYGGDHALNAEADRTAIPSLPDAYALALCRIEPENNVDMILNAWTQIDIPLVFVGNWSNCKYGRELKLHYQNVAHIHILDPIYEPRALRAIRDRAIVYVHGHSAGGTNPSLVEMMYFAIPVLAYDCSFNRYTTENRAHYFHTADELVTIIRVLTQAESRDIGVSMRDIAQRRYRWEQIGKAYFNLIS